jgi:hypothetical protein
MDGALGISAGLVKAAGSHRANRRSPAGFHLMSLGRELQISIVWLEVKDPGRQRPILGGA